MTWHCITEIQENCRSCPHGGAHPCLRTHHRHIVGQDFSKILKTISNSWEFVVKNGKKSCIFGWQTKCRKYMFSNISNYRKTLEQNDILIFSLFFSYPHKWTDRKLVPSNLELVWKKTRFYCHVQMSEYFHFKSILPFELAQGDMFRAQGHLLTSSELRDTTVQSPKCSLSQWNPFVWHNGISIDFQEIWGSLRLWTVVSWSSDGVRRCSWALNMSPWANWNGRIDLKWKYSLIWTCQ